MQILSRAFLGEKIKRQDVLTNRTLNGGGGFYTVDDRNQLVTEPSFSDVYDANGNLTTRSGGGSLYSFGYDNENRLITATWYNNSKSEFKYDGLSRLRTRDDYIWMGSGWYPNGTVRYLYDGMNVVQERSSANTPTAAYTRGPDLSGTLQGAGGIGGMLARSHGYSGGSWSTHNFYHADGMGNITFMANNSPAPAMVAKYKYDPYGRTITATGPLAAANLYRFSSKEINPATGMYYFGYRFYNPAIQRWMNRDPLEERAGLNLYDFTHNRPIWGVDTDGRFVQYLPTLAVGVGAGGLGISAGGVIALTTCAVPACLITGALLFNPPEPSPATYPSTGPRNAAPSSVQCDRKIIPFPGPRPSPKPAPEPEPEVPPPPGYERCTKNWDNNNPDPSQRVCFFECPSDGLLIMRTGKECNADHVPRRIPTP